MLFVCVLGVMDVVFYVCIVTRGVVGARVWEVCVFRHADVVCLLMLVEDARGNHMEELLSRSHDCLIGSHECLLLFTPSCCCECFYHL